MHVRRARPGDYEDVAAFTGAETTWPDRRAGDYLPEAFREWVERDDDAERTVVAERDGTVVGLVHGTLLTDHEGWVQGVRVAPEARDEGVGAALTDAVLEWARERGRSVVRNLVFDWNTAGMGLSRAAGFEPRGALRWGYLEPEARKPRLAIVDDPDRAWLYWSDCRERSVFGGLGFDFVRPWTLAELTRERLHQAAAEEAVFAVDADGATRAMSYRSRTFDRERESETERWAEYGAAAWQDTESARALLAAIATDAASVGADHVRIAIPETPSHVSTLAVAGGTVDEDASFVFAAEL